MQPFDKFKLAIAILWSLFTLYAVMLLLPPMHRRLRESEIKRKRGKGKPAAPNRPQRVVFLLLTCLMTANLLLVGPAFLGRWMGSKYLERVSDVRRGNVVIGNCGFLCSG